MNNKAKYLSLTELHKRLPVFFQPWWLDAVSNTWDIALVELQGTVVGVFPYQVEQKIGLTILRNPPLTPYLGPFFLYPPDLSPLKKLNWEERVFEELWQQIPQYDSFDIQASPSFSNFLLLHQKGFDNSNKITYHIDLQQGEERIFAAIKNAHRKRIQQAEPLYKIHTGKAYLPELMDLHRDTFTRKNKKYIYGRDIIPAIVNSSTLEGKGRLWVAKNIQGTVHGCIFTVHDEQCMYLLMSATDLEKAHHGTICLLIWNALLWAKSRGLVIFDFEGSMDSGIEPFFRRFGGERKNYLSFTHQPSTLWRLKRALLG